MKIIAFVSVLTLFSGCSSLRVTYDFDTHSDFSAYKTYAISEDYDVLPLDEFNKQRLLDAIDKQMVAKGFTKSENPDVLIDMHLITKQKTEAYATTVGVSQGYYGRYGYAGGFSTTQVNYHDYVEGALVINMVDFDKEKIVWQGHAVKKLDENASPQQKQRNIDYVVQSIFSRYPPRK